MPQLLAELEGELQAKDVAIAALKSECARGIANGMANPRFVQPAPADHATFCASLSSTLLILCP